MLLRSVQTSKPEKKDRRGSPRGFAPARKVHGGKGREISGLAPGRTATGLPQCAIHSTIGRIRSFPRGCLCGSAAETPG